MNTHDFNIFRKKARRAKAYLRLAKYRLNQYKVPRAKKNILSNDPRLKGSKLFLKKIDVIST